MSSDLDLPKSKCLLFMVGNKLFYLKLEYDDVVDEVPEGSLWRNFLFTVHDKWKCAISEEINKGSEGITISSQIVVRVSKSFT